MREELISFLWKFQYFNKVALTTTSFEALSILSVGQENFNAGPDFFNAQVRIDNQKWAGNIEIHVKASDWYVHGHENDANYENVILHVVWENDVPIYRKNNSLVATLELRDIVTADVVVNYRKLMNTHKQWINCENSIHSVDDFTLSNWLERLYFERLEQKSILISKLLVESHNDWETVLFKLLLKNFGLKVNGEAFFMVSNSIEFSIVRKVRNKLTSLEALFFGMAGLLENTIEHPHVTFLKKEFNFLKSKYRLGPSIKTVQFFRLRPNNFPTIRLAQLASLYHAHIALFSKLMNIDNLPEMYDLFNVEVDSFWDTHFTFEATSKYRKKRLSKSFKDLLLINTIIPLKFMYLHHIGRPNNELILRFMNEIDAEKNNIITHFSKLKISSNSATKSQALLQLKTAYCNHQRCLQCAIGKNLLSNVN